MMYAQDYDETLVAWEFDYGGSFPTSGNRYRGWPLLLQPYTRNTGICYDVTRSVPFVTIDTTNNNWVWSTTLAINRYGYSSRSTSDTAVRTLAQIPSPASRMAFIVERDPWGDPAVNPENNWLSMHWVDGQRCACPNKSNLDDYPNRAWQYNGVYKAGKQYHRNQYVVTYADGHAAKVPIDRMSMDSQGNYGTCENTYFLDNPPAATADTANRLMDFWGKWWNLNY